MQLSEPPVAGCNESGMYEKLDNPVWWSLSETHKNFSIDFGEIKFYHPDYCPFGGSASIADTSEYIDQYAQLTDKFFVIGQKPRISHGLQIHNELICSQMVLNQSLEYKHQYRVVNLTDKDTTQLSVLVNLVQPGYFRSKTASMGRYYGIFADGQLVAVSGERMVMNDFVEVSAVITHPDHRGKGYAHELIAHTVNNIIEQNKKPYLHVVEDNVRAIGIYKDLGFSERRKLSFWKIAKTVT
jgi:ribosomal protein S18 acetylase RimI-like enzyme